MTGGKTKGRRRVRRWVILGAILFVLFPVIESCARCPWVGYYETHFPKKTAMMKHRVRKAQRDGRDYAIRYDPVPMDRIAPALRHAAVIAEDAHFYEHHGIDFEAIRKAWEKNKKRGKIAFGGSTITQQLAKNLWLSPERSLHRKAVEAVMAVRLEMALDKERILELYLNVIEWGPGVFGAQEAARYHFHRSARSLTEKQASLLCAGIPAPRHFNPRRLTRSALKRYSRIHRELVGAEAFTNAR